MKTWLALGDSYTIGEGVPIYESYPYQALQLLRAAGQQLQAPEIIARTGWTSDELISHMQQIRLLPSYDYVSLLIGVNNQYRGMPEEAYAATFEWLAAKALELTDKVIVISIPDWGVTPFANDRDHSGISAAIDRFNDINKKISADKGFDYIDITTEYRRNGMLPESVVADQLHPSGQVYSSWAEKIAAVWGKSTPTANSSPGSPGPLS
ncbi:GDSL-type esterase/lipase family protein [Chitinophaga sp. XS-30]|uniref:SGNH/GDSL hydrolase family protein n=1 Tax=Chitinophaga sp. XS-30 TaxID=2604421 RepID=UPI0011DE22E3|nr:GDSL-type esterase/lipase family protein [Chitinophaga sp. XS-30]QEH42896.1 SGNH/GDSL hydrolase family protein [Chitinophaga sp. XS-30]